MQKKKKSTTNNDTEALGFLLIIPGSMGLILVLFLIFILIPYQISNGLNKGNMIEWLENNIEAQEIEYVEQFGDGNWSEKFFLYELDGERTAFNCWNKKTEFRGIDCKEVPLEYYNLMNR